MRNGADNPCNQVKILVLPLRHFLRCDHSRCDYSDEETFACLVEEMTLKRQHLMLSEPPRSAITSRSTCHSLRWLHRRTILS